MADSCEENNSENNEEKVEQYPGFKEICEGKAKILFPNQNTVFYNNVQVFNRDLSVAVIKLFSKQFKQQKQEEALKKKKQDTKPDEKDLDTLEDKEKPLSNVKDEITLLEALSATGLRAIRYALEIQEAITKSEA